MAVLAELLACRASTRALEVIAGRPLTLRRGGTTVATLELVGHRATLRLAGRDVQRLQVPVDELIEELAWEPVLGADPLACPGCGDAHARRTDAERAWREVLDRLQARPLAPAQLAGGPRQPGRWACDACLTAGRAVAARPGRQTLLDAGRPRLAYLPRGFLCRACGAPFVIDPEAQRRSYELHGVYIDKRPRRCPPCRQANTTRARAQADLEAARARPDATEPAGLLAIAAALHRLGRTAKASEHVRRARNQARRRDTLVDVDAAIAALCARGDLPAPSEDEVLSRFRAELAGAVDFLAIIDAPRAAGDGRIALADWACRVVTALALEAADAPADASALRAAPAMTLDTADIWAERLRLLVDRAARDPDVAAFERGDYQALVTVWDVDDCALAIATRAAAHAVALPAVDCAARLVRQLVGSAVVDYDYWRERAMSVPAGVIDREVDERCDRAERRYHRLFATAPQVLASLADALR